LASTSEAIMRVLAVIAIVSLLLPSETSAQRLPLPGSRPGPALPTPLPPQPEPIARPLAYKRMRLSVEAYPLISHYQSAAVSGTSFGTGTRADYRLTRKASATLDLTSSFVGGSATVATIEIGTRLRPERSERRAYPFVDMRLGYVRAFNGDFLDAFGNAVSYGYTSGFGAVTGVGMEYDLTRRFSLTTAASASLNRMTTQDFRDASLASYRMTSFRYTLGIRYNPGRMVRVPGSDLYNRPRNQGH
jgi:hypothetical protein